MTGFPLQMTGFVTDFLPLPARNSYFHGRPGNRAKTMNEPQDDNDFAETAILEDRKDSEQDVDPDATAVLGEEYRRKIESGSTP